MREGDPKVIREVSYGIIPVMKVSGEWKVLLVHHRAGHWAFPKGHGEVGETQRETAQRELLEETNLKVVRYLDETPYREAYFFRRGDEVVDKMVEYYLAEVEGEVKVQLAELSSASWYPIADAVRRISFRETRRLCERAQEVLAHFQV